MTAMLSPKIRQTRRGKPAFFWSSSPTSATCRDLSGPSEFSSFSENSNNCGLTDRTPHFVPPCFQFLVTQGALLPTPHVYISILLQLAVVAAANSIRRFEQHLWFHHCSAQHYQATVSCCCACGCVCARARECECTRVCVCVSFPLSLALICWTVIIQLCLIEVRWIVPENERVMSKSLTGATQCCQKSGFTLLWGSLSWIPNRERIHSVHPKDYSISNHCEWT